ncbi:MAG: peptidylprolyl isomerase [Saprospiraceae bacterium]|nr:peptidylprolyl isomerase [Candidatus Vicinibacter proximus]MBL7824820.1 peptidylprolyl isomerase [Saprospiraceae bacterium]MCC6844647.1 peptidylprolyl isomerase [Saprospiraceae bacterium]HRG32521.1 peptidylprolyl isomerase [Saprospiraceae bacterium]
MKLKTIVLNAFFILLTQFIDAQTSDPVLFTVNGNPVKVSEFEYIYNKNNGKDANFTKASLDEYLNLYTRFKLKVQAARDMKLDTIPALIKELEGYRQQLTTNYLNDKEVTDKLAKEVFERQTRDISVSHILFSLSPNALPEDTLKSYNLAMEAYRAIQKNNDFDAAAKKYSNDISTAQKSGFLGWFTAMLPDGFYQFENTIYHLKKGEISYPLRTRLGYHILKVNDIRPARRKIEAAHILFRKGVKGKPDILAQAKVDSIYKLIKGGASFEDQARLVSEDKTTAMIGGNVGFFGINQYESNFEDAAFSLEKDGDIAKPVETSIGWHIIKRLRKEEELPYERAKKKIQSEITRDSRFKEAQGSLIEKIKIEAKFKENSAALDRFAAKMDTNFFTYKWKAPEFLENEELGSLGDIKLKSQDFAEFVKSNTRQRIQGSEDQKVRATIQTMFNDYVAQKCLQYEETRLEDKYPEFKALMREYREGILLFEATKNVVWDRASEDTTGLRMFYEKNKARYKWDERALIYYVSIDTSDMKLANKIYKFMAKKSISKGIDKFDKKKDFIAFQKNTTEKKNTESYEGLQFNTGFITPLTKNENGKGYVFRKVEQILPIDYKSLDEARGFIIADYQDHLEALWIDELKQKYKVDIHQDVLNSLVKK